MTDEDWNTFTGRKVVFSYRDEETHERLHLIEGDVQLVVNGLVRLSGKWYRTKHLTYEAVLPVGATDAIQE